MGPTTSNQNEDRHLTYIFDERYGGKVDIISRKNKTYVVNTVKASSEQELNWMIDLSTKRARLKHRNFCTVRNYEITKGHDMCSKTSIISLYFDYYLNDMQKQIERRAGSQNYFPERYVGQICYSVVDCLRYLQEKGYYQGDIRAPNILLDTNGTPKLIDSYFTHFGKSNFELTLSSNSEVAVAYLSPQQLANMRKGHYSSVQQNKGKNQVFSLGMTMMEMMLLESSFDCYQMNLFRIVEPKIKQRRQHLLRNYSSQLVDLVYKMLQMEESKRIGLQQLLSSSFLRAYSPKISLSNGSTYNESELQSSRISQTHSFVPR